MKEFDRKRLVGSWQLQRWFITYEDGSVTEPLGSGAIGLLVYTPDGWMRGAAVLAMVCAPEHAGQRRAAWAGAYQPLAHRRPGGGASRHDLAQSGAGRHGADAQDPDARPDVDAVGRRSRSRRTTCAPPALASGAVSGIRARCFGRPTKTRDGP